MIKQIGLICFALGAVVTAVFFNYSFRESQIKKYCKEVVVETLREGLR